MRWGASALLHAETCLPKFPLCTLEASAPPDRHLESGLAGELRLASSGLLKPGEIGATRRLAGALLKPRKSLTTSTDCFRCCVRIATVFHLGLLLRSALFLCCRLSSFVLILLSLSCSDCHCNPVTNTISNISERDPLMKAFCV